MQTKPIIVYGIKNCDSVKKARAWLDSQKITYRFHDYRIDGLSADTAQQLLTALDLKTVLNQRSTSWRQLSSEQKKDLDLTKALQLILDNPTLIKRPIVSIGDQFIAGFNPEQYSELL